MRVENLTVTASTNWCLPPVLQLAIAARIMRYKKTGRIRLLPFGEIMKADGLRLHETLYRGFFDVAAKKAAEEAANEC